MHKTIKLPNSQDELLDVLIEGNQTSSTTVIFVHGFGTNKHETGGLFDDISSSLKENFRIVRFDLSGYGKSQGRQEDGNYQKHAKDLKFVLNWVKEDHPGNINIIAQSMGCFVTALLSPKDIGKTIMVSIPNGDIRVMKNRMISYFSKRGTKVNEQGITLVSRSTGKTQKIGPEFWKELDKFNPEASISNYSKNTNLLIIHPKEDEIIGDEALDIYQNLSNARYVEVSGNHSFKQELDRTQLIKIITNFLLS